VHIFGTFNNYWALSDLKVCWLLVAGVRVVTESGKIHQHNEILFFFFLLLLLQHIVLDVLVATLH